MKVRLLSLNVDKSMSFSRFQARIVSCIKGYSDKNDLEFETFENMREVFGALQDALVNDELIITAVDVKNYIKLKKAFVQAFETDIVYDPTVLNLLECNEEMDDDTRKDFSAFPEPATVFPTKDGLYSGFGITNGSQYILLLPIDNERINEVLRNGVIPFLSDCNEVVNDAESHSFVNEKISLAVARLLESESVVAVNGTQNAEVLKSCGDNVEGFDNVFIFTPHVEDKGNVNATEYAAQLAKVSLDLSSANIGASISDIYTSGETKFICIAVANDDSAVVRKLYISDDESEDAFVESAAVELIELIGEKASGLRSVGIEIASENNTIPEADKKVTGKKSMAVFAVVLGLIILLCAVLGIVYKAQGENGPLAGIFNTVFGSETTTTTTTEPSTTETTTEPEQVVVAEMKISDFMIADLINLEKSRNEEVSTEESTEAVTNESDITITEKDPVKGAPKTMTINGQTIEAKEALARLVMTEMGEGYDVEAIKAQTVAIYTYLKYRDNDFVIDGVALSEDYNDEVKAAVDAVFGEYLTYNDEIALTPYFEVAARKTTSGNNIFSKTYPYLKAVELKGNPDALVSDYKIEKKYSLGVMKGILLDYKSDLKLAEEPAAWLVIQEQDTSISSSIGYVTKMMVGGVEMSGMDFCMNVMGNNELASHCFTIAYSATSEEFTITTYGKGFGVGMSKTGANHMAAEKSSYKKILSTYFDGTKLVKEEQV